ncbi:MAG: Fic family protein [Saprospiraceae bacterium]|nr:Fic family protein [Saprospiraceae bacterium]MCF8251615.1 Fic family protein [Saprospiraceae bacterium]MCF8281336.1 Fic family protein [Bacteroidales bacterium]MCF8312295.1 Fic family protein [Saprospiraceae bacterium]MCF8442003.1 Fic family protein [Saprospiraceae bacterium]
MISPINIDFTSIEERLLALEAKKIQLDALRPLPAIALKNIRESLNLEWTYHSNSIEGNTLSLHETRMVIEEGFTIKGISLREHFEAVNHHEAIHFLEAMAEKSNNLDASDILEIHALVMQKIEQDFAGRYRNAGVRIAGANFVPPNALKVNDLMDELLEWVNDAGNIYHPIVKATIFHHRLVWIHPFFDGNGRTARLVYNLLLMREGYPPAIILKNDRKKYYDALNFANKGDFNKLLTLVMQAVERSLEIYLGNMTNTYEEFQPISIIAQDPEIPFDNEYLSLLARQGKIGAHKEGRIWLVSKKAILSYLENRKRQR